MLIILLLQLIYSFQSSSGAKHETLCTSDACFTLHHKELSFEGAQKDCDDNGGNLMTLRDRNEESYLLELIKTQHRKRFKVWIGLKRNKNDCMLTNKPLKGFKWISGEEDSQYSNWKKEPSNQCLERCAKAEYTAAEPDHLKWVETTCKYTAHYACKFSFRGMCRPLSLLGTGNVTYTLPFSREPLKSEIKLLPIGTFADIFCAKSTSVYSVCNNIKNTYNWTDPGPFCQPEKQNCRINNGGCEHLCHQDADAVRCFCKEGFELEEDGFSCRTNDRCGPDSCEHQCMTGESGIICKCPNGFRLSENQRNCSDIDECQSKVCRDRVCVNTPGSYTCVCKDGYDMIDGDCREADECARSGCEYGCLSDNGSFSCYCSEGFILSQDGHSCVDVNLCASNPCLSDFMCINTVGRYICTQQPKTPTHVSVTPVAPLDAETQDFTESLIRTTVELQHLSPHTDAPRPDLVNVRLQHLSPHTDAPRPDLVNVRLQHLSPHTDAPRPDLVNVRLQHLSPHTDAPRPDLINVRLQHLSPHTDAPRPDLVNVRLQHLSPHTDAPRPDLVNVTDRDQSNRTMATNKIESNNSKLLICVLGSVIPLFLLVTLTLFIIVFRCSRTKKEVKKKTSVDGYCWVSPGLDPRLEKLYESILTDDL